MDASLQERFSPEGRCFGCGPANPQGLRIRSFPVDDDGDEIVCEWTPAEHHQAFGGVLNGGIIGVLFDCHSNWAAAWRLMRRDGLERVPPTVTASFNVVLKRPTPLDGPVVLRARAVSDEGSKVATEATLEAGGKLTATCTGRFVAVKPGHPAYHRW